MISSPLRVRESSPEPPRLGPNELTPVHQSTIRRLQGVPIKAPGPLHLAAATVSVNRTTKVPISEPTSVLNVPKAKLSSSQNTVAIERLTLAVTQTTRLIARVSARKQGMNGVKEKELLQHIHAFVISRLTYALPYLRLLSAEKERINRLIRIWTCVPFCLWSRGVGQVPSPDADWTGHLDFKDTGRIFDEFATTALGGIPWQLEAILSQIQVNWPELTISWDEIGANWSQLHFHCDQLGADWDQLISG
ncbi:hypothetical protein HPB50_011912 [Hyalomma asiaticum]|uniref:Uncharacterized protein n=1 Tax=Hyalomma asiaticum TaxID=266040 RepID=A0ACB7TJF7_HYAAI|nr:hypothetical protein HPB50_011912 [Hyalomma asiaticum]